MTPITEDHVLSLMKGLEVREKNALKRLSDCQAPTGADGGGVTARLFSFSRSMSPHPEPQANGGRLVALEAVRAARRARRSVQGRFLYAIGSGAPSA
jgi:hypothetical protein